jgi:hypothetical protein
MVARQPSCSYVLAWVQRDAQAFFPELVGDDGALWFALDIDRRHRPLADAATVAGAMAICAVLDALELPYLLKFSGADGFHVLWSFGPVTAAAFAPRTAWAFERDVVGALRERAETHLANAGLPSPAATCDARDRARADLVLIDALILHDKATIRAPYSLHEGSRLVSVPLAPTALAGFVPQHDAGPSSTPVSPPSRRRRSAAVVSVAAGAGTPTPLIAVIMAVPSLLHAVDACPPRGY